MTIQHSIPIAQHGANGFYTSRFTFKFDTPIPAGVIPTKKRQPRPPAPLKGQPPTQRKSQLIRQPNNQS